MLDETGVKAIAELARNAAGQVVTVDGLSFIDSGLVPARQAEHAPKTLKITTLEGVAAFVNDLKVAEPVAVQVCSYGEVRVVSRQLVGEFRQRFVYAEAHNRDLFTAAVDDGGARFRFGAFHTLEAFVIGLQALFVDSDGRPAVLQAVGNVTDSRVASAEDDGVSQSVTGRKGVSLKGEIKVPNPVVLRPYRTFLEVDQPPSPFILRVRSGRDGGLPEVALFEADGGAWQLVAIRNIRDYLTAKVGAVPVLA